MIKLSANLSFLFTEIPFLERFKSASEAGFNAVEYFFPYKWEASFLKKLLDEAQIKQVLFNISPGSIEDGERGLASIIGREEEFQAQVKQSIHYAKILECPQIHIMAGIFDKNADPKKTKETFKINLAYAAEECGKNKIYALIEPINTKDIPGYFLNFADDAVQFINEINHPYLRLQLDLYHTQIMSGNLTHYLKKYIHLIKHIQIASPPDRNEPNKGEINYEYIFNLINDLKYDGYIGCEYKPSDNTRDGLIWAKKFGIKSV